jgi:tetratricopeptide (TPR) repeat protein
VGSAHAGGPGGVTLGEQLLPDRYRVISQVAVGGMGSIWAAEDRLLGRTVAVKVLAEQLAAQPLFVRRFQREARTAAALSAHPNVITIYDVGEHEGRPFIVMAYLPGGTLKERMEAGGVEWSEAVDWIAQAASALDFAHARDVVHRDVKPQNLLFDADGRLIVADLGIARAAYEDSLTASGELLGTASYISPEQAMGEPASPASDRYSLAIVAYELLTRSRPFGGASFAEQALQQVESDPEPPTAWAAGLPGGVDDVLLKGLAKDPEARWERGAEFASALGEALGTSPAPRPRVHIPAAPTRVAAPAEPPPARPAGGPRVLIDPERRWPREAPVSRVRRFRAPLVALASLLALGLIAGAAILATGGGDDGGRAAKDQSAKGSKAQKKSHSRKRNATAETPAQTASAAPAAPPPAETPAAPTTSGSQSPAALNDQGFRLMQSGRYKEAIPVLQRAVAAFPENSTELTLAYALYNLGHSLRLAGRPSEAVPILERRLRFANQRDVVRRELAAARAQTD